MDPRARRRVRRRARGPRHRPRRRPRRPGDPSGGRHAGVLLAPDPLRAVGLGRRHREGAGRRATIPLFPVLLGVVAYGRFVRGEADGAIEAGQCAVDVADSMGSSTLGLAERAIANAYFYREQDGRGRRLVRPNVGHRPGARGPEPRGPRPLHAVGGPDVDRRPGGGHGASPSAAAVLAARSGSPTAQAQADYAFGVSLEKTDPAPGAAVPRPQRAERGGGGEPVDPGLRPDREPVDPGPPGGTGRGPADVPRRDRHLVPGRRLVQPLALAPARVRHHRSGRPGRRRGGDDLRRPRVRRG